jgi:hypothetical protein
MMRFLSNLTASLSPAARDALGVAGIVISILLVIWLVIRIVRSRRKSPEEIERMRRADLHQRGRITTGQIVDFVEAAAGEPGPYLVVYKYEIAGVDYEVAQDLTALPAAIPLAKKLVGRTASLKYDPARPTNSIIAGEEWSGLPKSESTRPGTESLPASPEGANP